MDYRYETKDEARSFHERRRAFVILNNKVEFLPQGSNMSHWEYCKAKAIEKEKFNKITRGYYIDQILVFYKDNFIYDNDLIEESLKYIDEIAELVESNEFDIYYGQIPGDTFELDYHYGKYIDGKIEKV